MDAAVAAVGQDPAVLATQHLDRGAPIMDRVVAIARPAPRRLDDAPVAPTNENLTESSAMKTGDATASVAAWSTPWQGLRTGPSSAIIADEVAPSRRLWRQWHSQLANRHATRIAGQLLGQRPGSFWRRATAVHIGLLHMWSGSARQNQVTCMHGSCVTTWGVVGARCQGPGC